MSKQRTALITIRRDGVQYLQLPIVSETTHGFVCQTGQKESPATEWFPKESNIITSKEKE